jgi:hypothetical protein
MNLSLMGEVKRGMCGGGQGMTIARKVFVATSSRFTVDGLAFSLSLSGARGKGTPPLTFISKSRDQRGGCLHD